MKLYLKTNKIKEDSDGDSYLDVKFWSMIKFVIIGWVILVGIITSLSSLIIGSLLP